MWNDLSHPGPGSGAPRGSLIVTDDPALRALWRQIAAPAGFEVADAESVEAARAALAPGRMAVLAVDLCATGPGGLSLAREAQSRRAGCFAVAVTGYARMTAAEVRRRQPVFATVLVKPINVEDLASVFAEGDARPAARSRS